MKKLVGPVSRAATLGINFVFSALVGQILGAASAGFFFAWIVIVAIAGMLGRSGTDLYLLRHGSGLTPGSAIPMAWLRHRCTFYSLVATAAAAAFGACWIVIAPGDGPPLAGTAFMALSIPFSCHSIVSAAILRSNRRPGVGAFAEMGLVQAISIPLLIVITATVPVTFDIVAAIYLFGCIAASLIAAKIARPLADSAQHSPSRDDQRALSASLLQMALSSTVYYSLTWMPVISLSIMSNSREVSYFTAASRFTTVLNFIPILQLTATLPQIASLHSSGDTRSANLILKRISTQAALFCVPVAAVLVLIPEVTVIAFGESFAGAVPVLRVLGPATALIVLLGPVSAVMLATGHERQSFRLGLACLGIGVPASLLCSRLFGAVGAAAALIIVLLGFSMGSIRILRRSGIKTTPWQSLQIHWPRPGFSTIGITSAVALPILTWLTIYSRYSGIVLLLALIFALGPALIKLGWWRIWISLSIIVSVIRTNPGFEGITTPGLWQVVQFGTLLAAVAPLAFHPGRDRITVPLKITTLIWIFLSVVSAIWSVDPGNTIRQGALFALVAGCALVTRTRRWADGRVAFADLKWLYIMGASIQLVGIMAGLSGQEWAIHWGTRFEGLFGNPNYTGMFSAVLVVVGLALASCSPKRTAILLFELPLLVALIWSGSRGSILGLAAGALMLLLYRSARPARWALALGVPLMTVAWFQFGSDILFELQSAFTRASGGDISSGRISIWQNLYSIWVDNPLLGIGYDSIETLPSQVGLAAHNTYYQVLVELGVVGLCAVLAFIYVILFHHRIWPHTLLLPPAITVLVNEFTESSITGFGNSTALLSWLILLCSTTNTVTTLTKERDTPAQYRNTKMQKLPAIGSR